MVEQLEPLEALIAPIGPKIETATDLSEEIAARIEREPSDRVACRHVYGDHYRCHWWAPAVVKGYDNPAMNSPTVATHRVRKSAFLHVTRTTGGLNIRLP